MTRTSSRQRLESALLKIADPRGEGARACLTIYREPAIAAAEAADARARNGISLGPLDGAIVTIKDLFDVAGEVTRAGSKLIADEAKPAERDAPIVRRLRQAGAVIVAKTNMTEFAYSGIGANPHFGTPANPADRKRAPGGSSSGGAVAAADDMCEVTIGSDTGGSTRIPASLCGIVGFKPSRQRISTKGAFPLSYTLDSIGPMAKTVAPCAYADAVMAGEDDMSFEPASLAGLRVGVAQGAPLENLDATVGKRFPEALDRLEKAGARLSAEKLSPLLEKMDEVNRKGGIAPVEAYAVHRDRLTRRGDEADPIVRVRIERAAKVLAADYIDMLRDRAALIRAMDARLVGLDVLAMPTTPIVSPLLADVVKQDDFFRWNAQVLRNTAIWNFFDTCAITLPLPRDGGLPTGLMLVARNRQDRRLFNIAAAVERLFT
jgi:aspartyl-tRNA(Asn)/glutamyl-tRNA(Gln) amidotransferase subunit A